MANPWEDDERLTEEARITVRFDRHSQVRIFEHQDRLARRSPGVSVSVADAIRNLVEMGSRAWRASEKTGALSPAALLAALADEEDHD